MSLRTADLGSVCVASGPVLVNSKHPNRATHYPLYTSLCTGELDAIRKHKCFLCSPFYVKGVSLGHVGRNSNLKDLKAEPNGDESICMCLVYNHTLYSHHRFS
jgi:hypothetical protein